MNGGRYGIPFDVMTPDVFGEKFGGGRVPAGTRGFTWSDWAVWVAPDEAVDTGETDREKVIEEYQQTQVKSAILTLLIAGTVVGVMIVYDRWKESKKHYVEFKKSKYEEED